MCSANESWHRFLYFSSGFNATSFVCRKIHGQNKMYGMKKNEQAECDFCLCQLTDKYMHCHRIHRPYTQAQGSQYCRHTRTQRHTLCVRRPVSMCVSILLTVMQKTVPIRWIQTYSHIYQQCCACYPCEHQRKTNRTKAQRKQFECSSRTMHTNVSHPIIFQRRRQKEQ